MKQGSIFAVIAAAVTFFLIAQVASAQYPTPKTTLVCAVNQIDVKIDSSTAVAATLRDISGAPVAGHNIKFSVVSGNANLSSSNATTDSSGTAVTTVHFGSTAGAVVVKASSESSECQARTEVSGIVPPATGSAGLIGDDNGSNAKTAIAGFAVLALGLTGAVVLRRAHIQA